MANPSKRGIPHDTLNSPENITGHQFRVPSIIGHGRGGEYTFDGMHLPIQWQDNIPDLQRIRLDKLFHLYSDSLNLLPGKLEIDRTTGLVTIISVINPQEEATVILDRRSGIYVPQGITDIKSAIALQATLAALLSVAGIAQGLDLSYAYIEKFPNGWIRLSKFELRVWERNFSDERRRAGEISRGSRKNSSWF